MVGVVGSSPIAPTKFQSGILHVRSRSNRLRAVFSFRRCRYDADTDNVLVAAGNGELNPVAALGILVPFFVCSGRQQVLRIPLGGEASGVLTQYCRVVGQALIAHCYLLSIATPLGAH
jgi:hypothetical protein